MRCGKTNCNKKLVLNDSIRCHDCGSLYHLNCALIRGARFKKLTPQEKENWSCLECRGLPRNPSTIIGALEETPDSNQKPTTLEDIYKVVINIQTVLKSVVNEQTELLKQIKEVSESQQYLSDTIDELTEKVKKVESMESIIAEKNLIIEDLTTRVVQQEQYSRRTHLELGNIPPTTDENIEEIVMQVGEKMGVSVEKEDIAAAHRLRAGPGKIPSIIVEFVSRRTRNIFFENRKKLPTTPNKIYVNESLSSHYRNLLRLAKEKSKALNYKFCWYKNNKVFVKENESSTRIVINCLDDLEKLIAV